MKSISWLVLNFFNPSILNPLSVLNFLLARPDFKNFYFRLSYSKFGLFINFLRIIVPHDQNWKKSQRKLVFDAALFKSGFKILELANVRDSIALCPNSLGIKNPGTAKKKNLAKNLRKFQDVSHVRNIVI